MKTGAWILVIAVAIMASGCLTPKIAQRLDKLEERVALLETSVPVAGGTAATSSPVARSIAMKIRELDEEIEVLKKHLGEKHMKVVDTQARRDRLAAELKRK